MLWSIILRYQISEGEGRKRDNAKKSLLGWVNACLPEKNIKNFTSNWNDGRNLSALVDYCRPGLIANHASLDPYYRLENVTKAMNIAAKVLGVPQILSPEDLAVNSPDELSVMTYISGFCCPNSPGQNSLMEWINKQIPNCPATNFTTDWSDGQRLGVLTDSISGGLFPEAHQTSSDDSIRNCQQAIDAAHYLFGVEKTILPEVFADSSLDQLARMTYLTHFRHAKLKGRVSDPSKCIAINLPSGRLQASKTHSFIVQTTDAGNVSLSASMDTLHGAKKCMIKEIEEGVHTISFTPTETGSLSVEVSCDGSAIPGSPFEFTVNDPSKVVVNRAEVENGSYQVKQQPVDFRVLAQHAGVGDLSASVLDPNGREEDAEILQLRDKSHLVHYSPLKFGHHSIIIKFDGTEVLDVPLQIFVRAESSPQNVRVTQPASSTSGSYITDQLYTFHVNAADAGEGNLNTTSRGTNTDFVPNVSITDDENGHYTVTFETSKPDAYMVTMHWGEEEVPGSPFTLHVLDRPRPEKVVCSVPDFKPGSSEPIMLTVNAENAGSGELEASCMGNEVGFVDTNITEHAFEPRKYDVSFTPPQPDVYVIEVRLDGRPIPNCPFIVNTLQQCESVIVLDEDIEVFERILPFGQAASFRISTTNAGAGTLKITSRGPAKAEITTIDNKNNTCTCSFMPSVPGRYIIDVLFNDEHIKGSPYFLMFASKESIVIPGLEFQHESFKIGVPHKFKLHCADLGEGALEIECIPPTCAQVRVTQLSGTHSFQCEIIPKEIGSHNLLVRYNEKLVLGSPFTVVFEPCGDASKCHMIEEPSDHPQEVEDSASFHISTEGAGNGELKASVENASSKERIPVSVTRVSDDQYKIEFSPADGAEYLLTVKYDDQHIVGSPFNLLFEQSENPHAESDSPAGPLYDTIDSLESTAANSTCKAYGGGLNSCIIGKSATFIVDSTNTGPGKLTIIITGNDEVLEPTIFTLSDMQKEVQYTPTKKGKYTVCIRWGDKELPESPFVVECFPPLGSLFGSEQSFSRIFLGYL